MASAGGLLSSRRPVGEAAREPCEPGWLLTLTLPLLLQLLSEPPPPEFLRFSSLAAVVGEPALTSRDPRTMAAAAEAAVAARALSLVGRGRILGLAKAAFLLALPGKGGDEPATAETARHAGGCG